MQQAEIDAETCLLGRLLDEGYARMAGNILVSRKGVD